jgi:hypothetical protein
MMDATCFFFFLGSFSLSLSVSLIMPTIGNFLNEIFNNLCTIFNLI